MTFASRSSSFAAGLVFAACALACSRPSPTGVAFDRGIHEPSGLTASPSREGVWWTHGDSGTGNWLFAVNASGEMLARVRVKDTQNIDWEDITSDGQGRLWIGDIGNNESARRDLRVYRLPEPAIGEGPGAVEVEVRLPFRFAEQDSFGDRMANFDAEALFWWDAQLWLLTKHRSDDRTRLYRFPSLEPPADGSALALEEVASFDMGPSFTGERKPWTGQVTAADVAADGRHWAMLSYDAVFIFAAPPPGQGAQLFDELVNRVELDGSQTRQVEAMAWKGEQLLLVNEERAVFVIDEPLTRASYP